ncbi:MAG TPA: aminotransferase class I/II-fold pyridoxal phosphate-dependent enzyme [Thermoanaerobaculia bacterium]|jgi:cystathionine gamma-synthase|nr:aminotransferase class I/II-fold pyridoxal phosphate-dependent enzyme [Thermoanaerobaculia bacterium]
MKFETRVVHAGHCIDPATGAVAPPIVLSTTFARDPESVPIGGYTYVRDSNPNQDQLEAALAPLEGGEAALVFASGMAAGIALLQTLPPGSHVVYPDDAYYGFRIAAEEILPNWGIRSDFVGMEDLGALAAAIRPETRIIWLESPSNPLLKVVDLAAAADLARRAGALAVVDNTFATPMLQRPLELGADVVLHSTTKYLGGHSDVQGGALIFARRGELYEKVEHQRHIVGAVAAPFNSWLVLRGIRTLACRVAAQSATALAVARSLEASPAVSAVHYPGLPSHPGHDVARRQMSAFGAMLSFRAAGGREAALRAVSRVCLFTRATSLGGVESLIEHRATSEGPGSRTPQDLLRVSVGLEHADDLIADLEQALGPHP